MIYGENWLDQKELLELLGDPMTKYRSRTDKCVIYQLETSYSTGRIISYYNSEKNE